MPELILASASPRRRELLRRLVETFTVMPARVPEACEGPSPEAVVQANARRKVEAVARGRQAGVIVGADTEVVLDGTLLGKPRDREHAAQMLRALSGRVHTVLTGLWVLNSETGQARGACVATRVHVRPLSEAEIERYLAQGEYADCAGAYAIQGAAAAFVERLEGDLDNVMGLPLARLAQLLREVGYGLRL